MRAIHPKLLHAKRGWAASVIVLGVWEAAAVTTRRVPTITTTVRSRHHSPWAKLGFGLWAYALGRHLFSCNKECQHR